MKPFIAMFIVVLTCGFTQSYSAYGSKRFNKANVAEPMIPIYMQASQPQHYVDRMGNTNYLQPQPQYLSVPYPLPLIADDYNYNARNPNPNSNFYLYPQRQDYQQPLYGIPTYRGDYQPKPYSFAQPSYSSDDRIEQTNPLDYLHEEILQENERERSLNQAAFMQNLDLYNKQGSLYGRQQQLQKFQDLYHLNPIDSDDYDIDPLPAVSDWYDQTSILVDPSAFEGYKNDYQMTPQSSQQYPYEPRPSDYDDEVVRELQDLTKQNRKSSPVKQQSYNDWQSDEPQENDDVLEPEYEDDDWISWDQKRSIQPKKDYGYVETKIILNKPPASKSSQQTVTTHMPTTSSTAATTTKMTMENSKLMAKLHKGQKEVVLPRPATPVRRPFTEPVMKMMKANNDVNEKPRKSEQTPPIYKTIKQIIDMEQNLSHLSNNEIPTSKIRKRFVTNEEALVQQLNGLKRTSK